jgi:hypothetical protein
VRADYFLAAAFFAAGRFLAAFFAAGRFFAAFFAAGRFLAAFFAAGRFFAAAFFLAGAFLAAAFFLAGAFFAAAFFLAGAFLAGAFFFAAGATFPPWDSTLNQIGNPRHRRGVLNTVTALISHELGHVPPNLTAVRRLIAVHGPTRRSVLHRVETTQRTTFASSAEGHLKVQSLFTPMSSISKFFTNVVATCSHALAST